ncbi:MAG: hypothetical protein M1826_006143 [Phylliscum demangeonii]|nr:MAG: hypothetical protein M1826_006143 [Phylliscum demangeonii]
MELEQEEQPQSGYFDEIADIVAAREHPIIMVEASALRWMGLREIPEVSSGIPSERLWSDLVRLITGVQDVELLVRDKDIGSIVADLIATGHYELDDHNPADPLRYGHTRHVPRLRRRCDLGLYTHFTLWSETMYHISCDVPLVEVPDVTAANEFVVEDEFDPGGPDAPSLSIRSRQAAGVELLYPVVAQTAGCARPVYIPSIPVLIDALLDQERHRLAHPEIYPAGMGSFPLYHISNFIRYLYLEKGYRRDRILSKLALRNRPDMEIRMNRYKRKPVLKLSDIRTRHPSPSLDVPSKVESNGSTRVKVGVAIPRQEVNDLERRLHSLGA